MSNVIRFHKRVINLHLKYNILKMYLKMDKEVRKIIEFSSDDFFFYMHYLPHILSFKVYIKMSNCVGIYTWEYKRTLYDKGF